MSNGRWVGTWRPHRPRGPILAQYTSPGPKYCIQGATGFVSHIPTKRKAPAYSMHGSKPPLRKECSPGPYLVQPSMTNRGRKTGPAYTMAGRPTVRVEVTPGPGAYSPENARKIIYKSAPVHSMGYRTHGAKTDSTPGPNSYLVPEVLGPHTVASTSNPSYSITSRSKLGCFDEDHHKTPGPAAYQKPPTEVYKKRAPKYTMGIQIKAPRNEKRPGPTDYVQGKVSLVKSCAPVVSFGIRHSDYTTPMIVDVY